MKKPAGVFLVVVLCLSLLCACGTSDDAANDPSTDTPTPTKAVDINTVTIFTIDPSSMQILPYQVKTDESEATIESICDLVVKNLDEDDVRVDSAFCEDEDGIVVFDHSAKPIKGCDDEMEALILDCFANSILDNVSGCHNVIFRSDEGAYVSENSEFGEDEIYASN